VKTTGFSQRIKWDFKKKVAIPPQFKRYLWDYENEASLEILIIRVFQYGNFDEIREIYQLYPQESYKIACKYEDIKRGVKFWIKRWKTSTN